MKGHEVNSDFAALRSDQVSVAVLRHLDVSMDEVHMSGVVPDRLAETLFAKPVPAAVVFDELAVELLEAATSSVDAGSLAMLTKLPP
jgi:hypothetical protein